MKSTFPVLWRFPPPSACTDILARLNSPCTRLATDAWKTFVEFGQDSAPLILIDGFFLDEDVAWGAPPGVVYRAEEWMVDWIIEKIGDCLTTTRKWAGKVDAETEDSSK